MKKQLLYHIIIALMPLSALADEGMWMLYNLPDAVYERMKGYGFALPKSALYGDTLSLKDCVVNFSGYCTGELVSPDGLIMTNHHCGFESIRSHSTVEHDYMLNGFFADSIGAELPNDDMFVAFMKDQKDVTHTLDSLGIFAMDSYSAESLVDSLQDVLTEEARRIDTTYYVEIKPYYEGNVYIATTYQSYSDIRLVFAPTKSMGKFGGETDNWMWPRQTCDFSVFRVYVDPVTGGPAQYSPRNVPMKSANYLHVSTDGYREGDLAMVLGYPGSTERYLSSYGIREMRDCKNDPMQQVRGVKQAVMKRHMDASEAVRIMYDSKYAQSSNYWKNAIGMNKCIDSIGIIQQKEEYEKRIAQWMDSTGRYKGQLSFDTLRSLYEKRFEAVRALVYLAESFGRRSGNEIAVRATKYYDGMPVNDKDKSVSKQYVSFPDNSSTWDCDLDVEVLATLMDNYRAHAPQAYMPEFYKTVDKVYKGDCFAYVSDLVNKSVLMRKNAHIPVRITRKLQRDLGIALSMSLVETLADIRLVIDEYTERIDQQERYLCAAKMEMEEGMPLYSDANFTLRMSYGQVGGYKIAGYDSGYYTTAASMVRKMDQGDAIEDYKAESEFKTLLSSDDFGVFRDSVSNTLNLCFLTNNDITGGNSGSPVIDGKGRLIGLAFDGNWDSLSSDIFFDTSLARCINVDIRYVLYIMKQWGKADRLLQEMGVVF